MTFEEIGIEEKYIRAIEELGFKKYLMLSLGVCRVIILITSHIVFNILSD